MVVDSMRRDFLSCYGGRFQTPNMDRIADMGVRFNSFITHAPETYASIGSLLYGRYPHKHMIGYTRIKDMTTLGKCLLDYMPPNRYSMGLYSPYGGSVACPGTQFQPMWGWDITKNKTMLNRPDVSPAIKKIEEFQDDFFVYLYFFTLRAVQLEVGDGPPSVIRESPERWLAIENVLLDRVDKEVGKVLDALGDLRSDDFVLLTADHGESVRAIDGHTAMNSLAAHNESRYDSSVRIPALLAGLGLPSYAVENQVAQIDAFPTIVGLMGKTAEGVDGEDLSSHLRAGKEVPEKAVFIAKTSGTQQQAVRTRKWKLQFDKQGMGLFDLENDPGESVDVAEQHPKVIAELLKTIPADADDSIFTTEEIINRYVGYVDEAAIETLFGVDRNDKWAKRAEEYGKQPRVEHQPTLDAVIARLAGCKSVLDAGCGTGAILGALGDAGIKAVGIDSSPAMLLHALKRGQARVMPVEKMLFLDDTFDGIVCRLLLHHTDDPKLALAELRRVLKPTGTMLVIERAPPNDDLIGEYRGLLGHTDSRWILTYAEWCKMLEDCGFEITERSELWIREQSIDGILKTGFADRVARHNCLMFNRNASDEYKAAGNCKQVGDNVIMDLRQTLIGATKP